MEIQQHVTLKDYTTFKTGGFARLFCVVSSREELLEAVMFATKERIPFYILGGGSNILVSEKGFDGLVIKVVTQGIVFEDVDNCVELCRAIFNNMQETYPVQRHKSYKKSSKYQYRNYSYQWDDIDTGWSATDYKSMEICEGCNEWKYLKDIKYVDRYSTYMCKDCVEVYM